MGCVPSKTLIRATESIHQAGTAKRFAGIAGAAHVDDWRAAVQQKDELVAGLRQAKYVDLLASYDRIRYLEGRVRLIDGGVAVGDNSIKSDKLIIATGAAPALPSIPRIQKGPYLTRPTPLGLKSL